MFHIWVPCVFIPTPYMGVGPDDGTLLVVEGGKGSGGGWEGGRKAIDVGCNDGGSGPW